MKSKYPWTLIASVFIALGYIKYKDLKASYDADAARFEEQDRVFKEGLARSLDKIKEINAVPLQK